MQTEHTKTMAATSIVGAIAIGIALVVPLFLVLPIVILLAIGLAPFMWKVWRVRTQRVQAVAAPRHYDWEELERRRDESVQLRSLRE